MHFFDKKLSLLLLLFTLPLLFLPKINLIGFESETAGLRIDDFILLFMAILMVWAHSLLDKPLQKIEMWILVLTGFALFSYLCNYLLVSANVLYFHSKIFYALRLLEYFVFFYIGNLVAQNFKTNIVIQLFCLWNFLLMTLQKFNFLGGITFEGYNTDVSKRVQGVASFPSEMGLLANLLFCYLIYAPDKSSRFINLFSPPIQFILRKFYIYWMCALFGIFIIFTGNRISILALIICFLAKLKDEINWRSLSSLVLISVLVITTAAGMTFLMTRTDSVYKRSLDLFTFENVKLIGIVWPEIDITEDPVENSLIDYANYDLSWWIRIHKWLFIIKTYLTNPFAYLQGVGPGFAGAALDGGWLRIITEYGALGTLLFWRFFSCIYNINKQTKWMMIAFGLNMIFFDAYLAYKTMSFLFFATGYIFEHQLKTTASKIGFPAVA
jgi:hypothetical protein